MSPLQVTSARSFWSTLTNSTFLNRSRKSRTSSRVSKTSTISVIKIFYHMIISKLFITWYHHGLNWLMNTAFLLLIKCMFYLIIWKITWIWPTLHWRKLHTNFVKVLSKRLIKSTYYVQDVSNPNHGTRLFIAVKTLNLYILYIAN